jgi:hypothetical protein
MQIGYKEGFSWEELVVTNWESLCRELDRVLEMEVEGYWEEMARNELDYAKKTPFVTWSYSETVINPFPGYD